MPVDDPFKDIPGIEAEKSDKPERPKRDKRESRVAKVAKTVTDAQIKASLSRIGSGAVLLVGMRDRNCPARSGKPCAVIFAEHLPEVIEELMVAAKQNPAIRALFAVASIGGTWASVVIAVSNIGAEMAQNHGRGVNPILGMALGITPQSAEGNGKPLAEVIELSPDDVAQMSETVPEAGEPWPHG